ncbi:MAG: ATP synthase subunit I [Pyrinomonadaceae bacterium]|nr:ATP synthase subunit I [Pyrinomonadaceae bacterium]
MNQITDSMSRRAFTAEEDPAAVEHRIFRMMCGAVALAVLVSAVLAPWRVTTGLLLGGVLSLVNHHWLRTAIAAAFGPSLSGARPKIRIARYILRYFIVGGIAAGAYLLGVVSLTATLFGLCSFVVALMMEAFVQIYFAIAYRGEN